MLRQSLSNNESNYHLMGTIAEDYTYLMIHQTLLRQLINTGIYQCQHEHKKYSSRS